MRATIIILSVLFISVLIVPCLAQETFYFNSESINYNALDNHFLQWRIEQGAEVYTGRSYDIRGAIGTSGFVAHWSNWKTEDTDCEPDTIIPVEYQESNGAVNPSMFYIDPSAFPTGNYYQWDGCREWSVLEKQPDGSFQTVIKRGVYPNENRFAFTVKNPKRTMVPVIEPVPPLQYKPPAFVGASPDQIAAPVEAAPDAPQEEKDTRWWITYWYIILPAIGIIAYLINDEFDFL